MYMIHKKGKIKTNEINVNNIIPKTAKKVKKSKLLILFQEPRFAIYPKLKNKMDDIVKTFVQEKQTECINLIEKTMKCETAYINTNHKVNII